MAFGLSDWQSALSMTINAAFQAALGVALKFNFWTMIFVAESAKEKIADVRQSSGIAPDFFIRVSVTSGGCSGLSYKMDFDNEQKPNDQVFEDNGVKVVTDLKSFLYLFNTTLEFSGGLNGKGFSFNNPNAARTCGCGESFAV
ncbi:MAG: iron-sulfur cluster assembly accessory protein [Saprospiraceae bacterium]|nr:iron-sulfur cluster assembly accessory protein [Saprospiraceae bacterium]